MSITPDKAPESLLASDPNALFLKRTDEINELLDSGASLSGHERNCFFLNTGEGRFATASATSGLDFYDDARAVVRCDWDQDGDLDLFFSNRTAPRLRFLRNTQDQMGSHLAVRLVGTRSNRDAIGARVVLKTENNTLLRGLRAGEGFLGQSSKWLHFGLKDPDSLESLTVHWPGGKPEVFTGLKAGTRVVLTQGSGKVVEIPPGERTIKLPAREFEVPFASERAAVRLCARMPVPSLETITPEGTREVIAPRNGRPLLVMIWASWCPASLGGLEDLLEHEAELRQAGVDVLAVSVNGLGLEDVSTFEHARDHLKELGIKVTLRQADPDLLHQLQIIANQIVAQNQPLPLPSGFLLDASGLITSFYRGPVPMDHLLATARGLPETNPDAVFRKALPYPGTWVVGQPRLHSIQRLVLEFIDAGYLSSALTFAKAHKSRFESPRSYAGAFSAAGNHHGDLGAFETAIRYYREALSEDTDSPSIHFNLALALERLGRIAEALQEYRRAIELDPKITVAHLNLGAILARSPNTLADGVVSLREAIRLNPNLAASYYHLGMALERSRDFPGAYQSYRKAALLAPDHYGNSMQLAHLLERSGKLEDALLEYQRVATIHPKNPQVPFQMGMVHEKRREFGEAITSYRKAIQINADYVPALNNLAVILATQPDHLSPEEANKLALQAAQMTRFQQPAILDTLASAQLASGNPEEAKSTLSKALTLATEANQKALVVELKKRLAEIR